MKHVWKTEDAHEDLIHVVQSAKTDIKRVDDTLKLHTERMDKSDARTDILEKQVKQILVGSPAASVSTSVGPGGSSGG
eukprot:6469001-Pyramimonas_sp.AAC.1